MKAFDKFNETLHYLLVGSIVKAHLEDTGSVSEGGDVSSSVLLVHGLSCKFLSDHVADDAKHGSAAVVELGVELAGLFMKEVVGLISKL